MIHEIAIWKLIVAGAALVCGGFLLGSFLAVVCAAAGRADDEMERLFAERR